MIKEIGSFKFPGFYESIFSNSDEFIDMEYNDKIEIADRFGILEEDITVVYEYNNFQKYERDVCKEFMKNYVDEIKEVLPSEITNYHEFKFDIIEEEDNIVIISPKYYNYSTDRCYCNIETNRKTLKLIKEYTLKLNGVTEYLLNNFTSCDGFISFVSNDIDVWKKLDIEDYEQNMLIALLDMLISLSDKEGFEYIIITTWENVSNYYYASPTIYYKNKEITMKELEDLFPQ